MIKPSTSIIIFSSAARSMPPTAITIQSENLQNAESRIRDVDVATEMTNFVRNQVLTQSAVAMLSQANSMPQMAMQLIG